MAATVNTLVLRLVDKIGKAAKVVLNVALTLTDPSNAAVAALRNALILITRVDNPAAAIVVNSVVSDTETASAFSSQHDKGDFVMLSDDGTKQQLLVPVVAAALCDTDGSDKINITTGVGLAFVTALKDHAKTANGAAFTDCTSARRIWK